MSLGEPRDTSRRHVRCVSRLVFPLALIGSLWTATALADSAGSRIDIGPGPLQAALEQLADQTQLQILYDPALVRGLSTHGVNEAKTPSEALKQLLATTGITFEFTADDAVALHTAARNGPS